MKEVAVLLESLIFTTSTNTKIKIIVDFLKSTSNNIDKGYTIALLTNKFKIKEIKSKTIKEIIKKKVDPYLFDLSYDYVGDLAETIALIWNGKKDRKKTPSLNELIEKFKYDKSNHEEIITEILDHSNANTRWAFIKILLGGLRVGVSTHIVKKALAIYGNKSLSEIETIWNGIKPPFTELLKWLENKGPIPEVNNSEIFHSLLLAHSIDIKEASNINIKSYFAEYKWDGIRVQIVSEKKTTKLFSRSGEDITNSFPEIKINTKQLLVLDGELLIKEEDTILPFHKLQKRINKKKPSKKQIQVTPAFVKLYDILFYEGKDVRSMRQLNRKNLLRNWYNKNKTNCLDLSETIDIKSISKLKDLYFSLEENKIIEGLMLKNKNSNYIAGRKKDIWYKLKKDPKLLDAILMYAQRGHGKRSSYYSDYTFGIWSNNMVIPIAKAYSGYTNKELEKIDKFVRANTIATYGPVKEVKKELVFELAFDSIHISNRHKSGIALRFPRINRIRWDKPANEVLGLAQIKTDFKLND